MMNKTEYLLTCIQEECAEIIQACSKAKRFGLDMGYPVKNKDEFVSNAECIVREYFDLQSVIEMLEDENFIFRRKYVDWNDDYIENLKAKKKEKVEHFMGLSRENGCLENE